MRGDRQDDEVTLGDTATASAVLSGEVPRNSSEPVEPSPGDYQEAFSYPSLFSPSRDFNTEGNDGASSRAWVAAGKEAHPRLLE